MRPSRAIRIAAIVGLALAVVAVARLGVARRDLGVARTHLAQARTDLAAGRADAARRQFAQAERSLRAARGAAGFPVALLDPVPVLGSAGRAVEDTAAAGLHVTAAGRLLADAAAALPTSGRHQLGGHDLAPVHAALTGARQPLAGARAELSRAASRLRGPAGAALPVVSSPARQAATVVEGARRDVDRATRATALLAGITAPEATTRILLLSQDTLEGRPTGGYVGSLGLLSIERGRVTLERYESYEQVPFPSPALPAPANLAPWLRGDQWDISNVNWWPDFPTVAATAKEMYARAGRGDVDAVIAINEKLVGPLLKVLGPVTVPGYRDPVAAEGLEDRILWEVELKRPLDTPRKKFLTGLSHVVMEKLFTAGADKLPALVAAVSKGAAAGDVQAWFAEPGRQDAVAGTTWAGALPRGGGDFLLLADSNMWASKANRELYRTVHYRVDEVDGRLVAHLRAEYENKGAASDVNPTYLGYLRVYAPLGSVLSGEDPAQTDEGEAPDGPYQVFSTVVRADPGARATVSMSYVLPASVAPGGAYRLRWARQPGTPNDTLVASAGGRTVVGNPATRELRLSAPLRERGLRAFLGSRWLFDRLGL